MAGYQDVSWSDDENISSNKLNRMTQSIRYLKEQQVPIQYKAFTGVNKSEGLRIACGLAHVARGPLPHAIVNVYFGTYFTPGCNPVILTTLATRFHRHMTLTMCGLGGTSRPDHVGFSNVIQTVHNDPKQMELSMIIHWMAIGW